VMSVVKRVFESCDVACGIEVPADDSEEFHSCKLRRRHGTVR
jgi:hypothetical protein